MFEMVFDVPEPPPTLLDDPLAEMTRLVIIALLDAVQFYVGDQIVTPDAFSFIGFDESKKYPIYPTGGETDG